MTASLPLPGTGPNSTSTSPDPSSHSRSWGWQHRQIAAEGVHPFVQAHGSAVRSYCSCPYRAAKTDGATSAHAMPPYDSCGGDGTGAAGAGGVSCSASGGSRGRRCGFLLPMTKIARGVLAAVLISAPAVRCRPGDDRTRPHGGEGRARLASHRILASREGGAPDTSAPRSRLWSDADRNGCNTRKEVLISKTRSRRSVPTDTLRRDVGQLLQRAGAHRTARHGHRSAAGRDLRLRRRHWGEGGTESLAS